VFLVLVLVLQVWYCFVKNDLVTFVVIMILKDTATFQVLFVVSLFCNWNITTAEINSETVTFTYLKVKSAKCICLLPVVLVLVLVLRIWSCLHHWLLVASCQEGRPGHIGDVHQRYSAYRVSLT